MISGARMDFLMSYHPGTSSTASAPPVRVLLADDDPDLQFVLKAFLTHHHFDCVAVRDGTSALVALSETEFDLLITDVAMPGNQSLELVGQVAEKFPNLPVILLTGQPTLDTAINAVRLPVAAYFVKPPNPDELLATAQAAVAKRRADLKRLDQSQRLRTWIDSLPQLHESIHAPRRSGACTAMGSQADMISSQHQAALAEFMAQATEVTPSISSPLSWPTHTLLEAIRHTVRVLRETRQNFKSKRLAALRKELEAVIKSHWIPPGAGSCIAGQPPQRPPVDRPAQQK